MFLPSTLLICSSSPMRSIAGTGKGQQGDSDQFKADPFLGDLARSMQCCFAGIPHAKGIYPLLTDNFLFQDQERQQNFLQSTQISKKIHIVKKFKFPNLII